jgi:hypothetical protein
LPVDSLISRRGGDESGVGTNIRRYSIVILLISGCAFSQPALRFKTRSIETASGAPVANLRGPHVSGHGHLMLQFENPPTADMVTRLKSRSALWSLGAASHWSSFTRTSTPTQRGRWYRAWESRC